MKISKQKTFNRVAEHLLKQNSRSLSKEHLCAYRGIAGKMCAVGCLINDKQYTKDIEGVALPTFGWGEITLKQKKLSEILKGYDISLLKSLQVIHDCYQVSEWKLCLIDLAMTNNLDYSVCEKYGN